MYIVYSAVLQDMYDRRERLLKFNFLFVVHEMITMTRQSKCKKKIVSQTQFYLQKVDTNHPYRTQKRVKPLGADCVNTVVVC